MTRWVGRLVYANALMYLASLVFPRVASALVFVPAYALVRPWTLVTYMFLHGGLMHLAFNMLSLFFFGPRLEARLGGRRFLTLYCLSGIGGAALSFLFQPYAAIIGASGAVFGVNLGYAYFWPRDTIYVWGVIPVQARVLVLIMTGAALWGGFGRGDGIAHFAHLGGFAAGLLYLKLLARRSPARRFQLEASAPPVARAGDARVKAWESIRRENLHTLNREELDRILDKLRTLGPTTLTADERAFLDRFAAG